MSRLVFLSRQNTSYRLPYLVDLERLPVLMSMHIFHQPISQHTLNFGRNIDNGCNICCFESCETLKASVLG